MNKTKLKSAWKKEEQIAFIKGWDFSHIHGRYDEENDLPWDYEKEVRQYLNDDFCILDYDTGGGEFLLSLNHPFDKTPATEGYKPNVRLCRKKLLPLGIIFKECDTPTKIPYDNETFDMIINRHGDFDAREIYRLLKNGGIFVTEQIGGDNDRELFEDTGFHIIRAEEVYRPIKFYDVGAFVWFANILEWEFPDFSVDKCFHHLLKMQRIIEEKGIVEGTIHRYLIVAKK